MNEERRIGSEQGRGRFVSVCRLLSDTWSVCTALTEARESPPPSHTHTHTRLSCITDAMSVWRKTRRLLQTNGYARKRYKFKEIAHSFTFIYQAPEQMQLVVARCRSPLVFRALQREVSIIWNTQETENTHPRPSPTVKSS